MTKINKIIQGSLFEDEYLIRSLGNIVKDPEYALTELVANAWDAGATKVHIKIPSQQNDVIKIEDNGVGMTPEQFKERWMKLGYDRTRHQEKLVEFPPGVTGYRRLAYGRNGVGRHAMFCFADQYRVLTKRDGKHSKFTLEVSSGQHPFVIVGQEFSEAKGYGTTIEAETVRNLPNADAIRESLSARFIHDPNFIVFVDGTALSLATHPGVDQPIKLTVPDVGEIEVFVVETQNSARTKQKQGFAFWFQNRLIGEPSWTLGSYAPVDARTTFGRRFTILVQCDCMGADDLELDWSDFKKGRKRNSLFKTLNDFALSKYQEYSAEKVDDTKRHAFQDNLSSIRPLSQSSKFEVAEFVEAVVEQEPTISPETLSTAVQAVINLQQTRSGQRLLEKLSSLPSNDIDALDKLLSEWSVQDALTVLDEIDRRIATVRAIEILAGKKDTDELHTLHPLVTESRWLFGAEFETSEYASNLSLKNAVNKVFKVQSKPDDYPNWRKRPDLLMLAESTLSAVALEDADRDGLAQIRRVLLLELKKGDSQIGRNEMGQAEAYADDIRNSGCIAGQFFIHSFVVGARIDQTVTLEKTLGSNGVEHASIRGVCFSTLTQTASKRMFKLKERLQDRYETLSQGTHSKVLDELLRQQVLDLQASQ